MCYAISQVGIDRDRSDQLYGTNIQGLRKTVSFNYPGDTLAVVFIVLDNQVPVE
jgi:hypothetical protein